MDRRGAGRRGDVRRRGLSRTTGLPGFYEAEWEPLLLASLVLELVYVALYVTVRRPQRSTV